jgi:hypothetical protein
VQTIKILQNEYASYVFQNSQIAAKKSLDLISLLENLLSPKLYSRLVSQFEEKTLLK